MANKFCRWQWSSKLSNIPETNIRLACKTVPSKIFMERSRALIVSRKSYTLIDSMGAWDAALAFADQHWVHKKQALQMFQLFLSSRKTRKVHNKLMTKLSMLRRYQPKKHFLLRLALMHQEGILHKDIKQVYRSIKVEPDLSIKANLFRIRLKKYFFSVSRFLIFCSGSASKNWQGFSLFLCSLSKNILWM